MKKDGARVYYIDPVSLRVLSVNIMDYELRGGSTYMSEAFNKMPNNVENYSRELTFDQIGCPIDLAYRAELEEKAQKLKDEIV